ncbi:hypothetical protein MRB53_024899 [Persea americana]|uniref:Uncharacterized protein n=1 Tax=Persea americana TaxID=3435 RepID=A0ACC2LDT2_PERAE|nr:hypothetical protein MRB53_024899 [Persea americana]
MLLLHAVILEVPTKLYHFKGGKSEVSNQILRHEKSEEIRGNPNPDCNSNRKKKIEDKKSWCCRRADGGRKRGFAVGNWGERGFWISQEEGFGRG